MILFFLFVGIRFFITFKDSFPRKCLKCGGKATPKHMSNTPFCVPCIETMSEREYVELRNRWNCR